MRCGHFPSSGGDVCPDIGEVLVGSDMVQTGERKLLQLPALFWRCVLLIIKDLVSTMGCLNDYGGIPSWCYL